MSVHHAVVSENLHCDINSLRGDCGFKGRLNGLLWHCEVEQEFRLMSQLIPKPVTLITVTIVSQGEAVIAPKVSVHHGLPKKHPTSSLRILPLILDVPSSFPYLLFSLQVASF